MTWSNAVNYLLEVAKISIFQWDMMTSFLKVAKIKIFSCNAVFLFVEKNFYWLWNKMTMINNDRSFHIVLWHFICFLHFNLYLEQPGRNAQMFREQNLQQNIFFFRSSLGIIEFYIRFNREYFKFYLKSQNVTNVSQYSTKLYKPTKNGKLHVCWLLCMHAKSTFFLRNNVCSWYWF